MLPFAIAALAALAGCAHGREAELSQMRETLDHVQADAEGRVGQLDGDGKDDAKIPAQSTDKARKGNTPQLQSVRLNASDMDEADVKEDADRPQLKMTGQPGYAGRRGRNASSDRSGPNSMEPSGGPVPESPAQAADPDTVKFESQGTPGRPSALDPAAKRAYEHALGLVHDKKYDAALDALAGFLVKWPDHPYADNAHYWRGECYFAQGKYEQAESQFAGLVARFPLGNKVPDALLKLSITRTKLGKTAEANAAREQLERDFPRTDAARRARGEAPSRKEKQ